MAKQTKTPANKPASRVESALAYMAVGLIGTSIIAMVAALIIAATGNSTPGVGQQVLPAFLVFYPQFGLVAGAAAIIGLLLVSIRRRTRENRK